MHHVNVNADGLITCQLYSYQVMSDDRSEADHSNDQDNEGDDTCYKKKCDAIMQEKITAGNHEGKYVPGIVNIVENTEVKVHMMTRQRGWT